MEVSQNDQAIRLPIKYPIITSYPYHANLLSVISNQEGYLAWLLNHYIQILTPIDINIAGVRLDYYQSLLWKSCPWVYYQRMSRDLISKKWGSIIHFIIDSVALGYCVYFTIDKFYIPLYSNSDLKHQIHDIMVFGYNQQRQIFDVADNFKNGVYSYEEATFEQIELGYENVALTNFPEWLDGVELISPRKKNRYFEFWHDYQFDPELVRDFVKDYLLSINTIEKHKVASEQWKYGNLVFGMEVYNYLEMYVKLFFEKKTFFDLRPFFVLWEHKKIMLLRIQYMIANNYLTQRDFLDNRFREIEQLAQIIKNLWIKLYLTNDGKIVIKMIALIRELASKEREGLEILLNNLKSTS